MFKSTYYQVAGTFTVIWGVFVDWLPRVFGAVIVLILGLFVADMVRVFVKKAVQALKIDKASEKVGVSRVLKTTGITLGVSGIISELINWIIILVFLSAAANILGIAVVTEFIGKIINWIPSIIAGLIIMLLGIMAAEAVSKALDHVQNGKAYKTVVRWAIWVLAFITAIEQIGINITFLTDNIKVVVAGAVLALAISFGLGGKDKAKDIIERHIK